MQRLPFRAPRAFRTRLRTPLLSPKPPHLTAFRTYVVDKAPHATGTTTFSSANPTQDSNPYHLITGHALFAKRPSRPFPPPFLSHPSSSFSDPLSTYNRSIDKRRQAQYEGEPIRGVTNGDDAVLAEPYLIAVGDGVGQWAQKERGHAALWSRLILHFLSLATTTQTSAHLTDALQTAYTSTIAATAPPNECYGTTTASAARLSYSDAAALKLDITQLGDSAIFVLRPSLPAESALLFKTEEQWHWFDCPRQLGTNSPDTPAANAVTDSLPIREDDVVVAMSDGVSDNLWVHEVVSNVCASVRREERALRGAGVDDAMTRVAAELVRAARVIAEDPFAESPFMERAVEEGLPTEGGKLDDISVVVGICRRKRDDG